MKVMITGHRPNKLGNDYDLKSDLTYKIRAKIIEILFNLGIDGEVSNGITKIEEGIGGMALGIDMLFTTICLELGIPFTAYVPCRNQDKMWPQKSKDHYKFLLEQADKIVLVNDCEYNQFVMQSRNKAMVDAIGEDGVVIAVWDGTPGGTANCVSYAKSKNKTIIQINPKQL